MKPHCIFPGTAEPHWLLVHITFGNKDVGPPFGLPREASCRLTCTHTTTYAHTQLTDTVRYRHVNTATQLSAQRWLASPARPQSLGWCYVDAEPSAQPQSARCSGMWRGAELCWGKGLRDCTTLTRSGEVSAQEGESRGTHVPSRQTILGAWCPKIAMARLLVSLPLLGFTVGVSALRAKYRQVCSWVH